MTSDTSDASDVDMEDAPPTTWDHLSEWIQVSGRAQCDHHRAAASIPPKPVKCRAERKAKHENQRSVLAYLRPVRWTKAPMELNLDVLEIVADALMRTSDARTLRALAVVNRECAAAVRNTLRAACDKLRECAEEFAEAQDSWRLTLTYDDENATEAQLERMDATEARRQEALCAYEDCMRSTGIHMFRVQALARKPWSRWFHGSTSLLGHLQMGCELCSSDDNVRDTGHRAGPVSLFACCKCAHKHRVRFELVKHWTDRTFHHPKGWRQRLTVRFPRNESDANSYACALMSKRESHQRRMGGSRIPKARRTVPLSRRVYTNQPWTFELQDSWQLWSDEERGPKHDTDEMSFELWHELPPSIPAHLTFASVMKLGSVGESTRLQAASLSAVRRRDRATTDARRAAFNRIARTHRNLVRRVNNVVNERGFRAWIQVVELCCAARAFELRWLFKAEESRFGDWRKVRYQLLDMHPTSLLEAAHRVSSAVDVLQRVRAQVRYVDGTRPKFFLGRAESTRACVVEIVKHLPMACLSPGLEDKLYAKVQHLRHVVLRLYVIVDPLLPEHNNERLLIKAEVDPLIIGRTNLELYAMITEYTISKLSHLAGMPDSSKELTPEILRRVRERVNDFVDTTMRDHVRAELYGLPGAWPCLLTWERND
jgi:hypothetical protein